ncbi:MAG TPA: C1 family peptidase [Thermoanaerobacterales bacterium]|nr:C1 family peptidase [Thermoanaerobacterales bacterium]
MSFENRPLGVIPSPPDFRDYRLNEFTDVYSTFPNYYLVPPYEKESDVPIYDQGYTSMCVAFTGATITEQQEYDESGKFVRVSPGWIYGNRDTGMYMGEGMVPREAWAMLCKDGVPPFEDLSFVGSFGECYGYVWQKREALKKKAENFKKKSYVALELKNKDEIRTAIIKCGAINVSIAVHRDFDKVSDDGFLTSYTDGNVRGYHSVTCVGFMEKNDMVYLIIVNSWGKEWGKNGICYMPYNYRGIQELWAITDMKRRVVEATTEAIVIPPGHFVIPFRGLFEAENAEEINWGWDKDGKVYAEAILPPAKRRKIHVLEGSKDIVVETLE